MANVILGDIRLFITQILAGLAAALGPSLWLTLLAVLAILITYATVEARVAHRHRSGSEYLSERSPPGISTPDNGRDRRRVGVLLITLLLVVSFVGLSILVVVQLNGEPSLPALVFALMLTGNALLLDLFLALYRGVRPHARARDRRPVPASRCRRGVSAMAKAAITTVPCVLLVADPEVPVGLIGVWLVAIGATHVKPAWGLKMAGDQGARG